MRVTRRKIENAVVQNVTDAASKTAIHVRMIIPAVWVTFFQEPWLGGGMVPPRTGNSRQRHVGRIDGDSEVLAAINAQAGDRGELAGNRASGQYRESSADCGYEASHPLDV